ncbi:MAG: hypothetical protein AAF798_17175, partial [Bacteroidota bacterium]
ASCATDDPIPISDEEDFSFGDPQADKNYMLFTRSGSSANGFVTGFDTFPSGQLDIPSLPTTVAYPAISGGIAFRNYVVNQQKLFGGPGYERLILDEAFIPRENGIIETFGGGSAMIFLNEFKGYYVDNNALDIQIFDPATYLTIGTIDLSDAFTIPTNPANYYSSFYVRGNRLFACLYTGLDFPPFVYQSAVGSIIAVIDTDTDTYLKTIFKANTKYPGQPFLRFQQNAIDEEGTIYVVTQGGLGFDASSGENTPGTILKILAQSDDFDPNYSFQPQLKIGSSTATIVVNSGFLYAADGIAYTNVLLEDPMTATDLVNQPLMRWAKLDLVNQTARLVEGVPANVGFTAGMAYYYEDKVYLTVYNPEEGINALYETATDSNMGTLKLDIEAGGIIYGLYQIDENN